MKQRLAGVDAFRLLAALCVIALHMGTFPMFDPSVGTVVRLSSRWAVPFFFIVAGYFLGQKHGETRAAASLARSAVIFGLACLIMIPLDIYMYGPRAAAVYVFDEAFLHRGSYFHLWFLSAMVIGLLAVQVSDHFRLRNLLPAMSCVALALYLLLGAYNPISERGFLFAEEFSGIPFLYTGMLLARRPLSVRWSVALAASGFVMQLVEVELLFRALGKSPVGHAFLIGTIPFSIGMFGLASHLPNTTFMRSAGRLGARYVLGIYVIHPYFIAAVDRFAMHAHLKPSIAYGLAAVPTVFLLSLGCLLIADQVMPFLVDLLSADKEALQRLDSLFVQTTEATEELTAEPGDKSPPAG